MRPTMPEWIPRRDPLEDAREALAVHVDRRPRLCDLDWLVEETPLQVASRRLVEEIAARASALADRAASAGDRRGVLITYRRETDSVYADVVLSDEVPVGQVESRGSLW